MFLIRPSEYYYVKFIQIRSDYSDIFYNSGPPPDVSILFHMFLNNYTNVCFIFLLDKWTDNTENFGDGYKYVFNVLILTILFSDRNTYNLQGRHSVIYFLLINTHRLFNETESGVNWYR